VEGSIIALVERDAVPGDVHEKVAAMREPVVHFLQCVDDEIDRGPDRSGNAVFAHQPLVEPGPVFDPVGEPLVVDHDQQVIVGLVALGGVRFVDPAAARIRAVEHDLENAAGLLPFVAGERKGVTELFKDDCDHPLELALLAGRKVVKLGAHARCLAERNGKCLHQLLGTVLINRILRGKASCPAMQNILPIRQQKDIWP